MRQTRFHELFQTLAEGCKRTVKDRLTSWYGNRSGAEVSGVAAHRLRMDVQQACIELTEMQGSKMRLSRALQDAQKARQH